MISLVFCAISIHVVLHEVSIYSSRLRLPSKASDLVHASQQLYYNETCNLRARENNLDRNYSRPQNKTKRNLIKINKRVVGK